MNMIATGSGVTDMVLAVSVDSLTVTSRLELYHCSSRG